MGWTKLTTAWNALKRLGRSRSVPVEPSAPATHTWYAHARGQTVTFYAAPGCARLTVTRLGPGRYKLQYHGEP